MNVATTWRSGELRMGGCGQRIDKMGVVIIFFWGPQFSFTTYPNDMLRALAVQSKGHVDHWTIYCGPGKGNIDFYTVHWGALKPSWGEGCCHTQGEQLCLFVQYLRLLAIKQGQSQMASCTDYQRCSLPCNTPRPGEHFFSSAASTTSPPLSSHSFPVTPSPDFI